MTFIPNEKLLAPLVQAARNHKLVPFVGAGLSLQVSPPFPTWGQFIDEMNTHAAALRTDEFGEDGKREIKRLLGKGQYLMAAEHLREMLREPEYTTFLEATFKPSQVIASAPVHKRLFDLKPPLIITTNYDRLLEDAGVDVYHKHIPTYTYLESATLQRSLTEDRVNTPPMIFKIHGSFDKESKIVLTENDYRELLYKQPGYRAVLSAIFLTHKVLMLGFSFEDRELNILLETLRESFGRLSSYNYIFLPLKQAGKVRKHRLREDYGLEVITYRESSGHPEVFEFVDYLIKRSRCDEKHPSPLWRLRPSGNNDFAAFGRDRDGFEAYVHQKALAKIDDAACQSAPGAVIGLLAGRVCQDDYGVYTIVSEIEEAASAEAEVVSGDIRIPADNYKQVKARLEKAHPVLEITGWYHSHPTSTPLFTRDDLKEQSALADLNHVGIVVSCSSKGERFKVYRGPNSVKLDRRAP